MKDGALERPVAGTIGGRRYQVITFNCACCSVWRWCYVKLVSVPCFMRVFPGASSVELCTVLLASKDVRVGRCGNRWTCAVCCRSSNCCNSLTLDWHWKSSRTMSVRVRG